MIVKIKIKNINSENRKKCHVQFGGTIAIEGNGSWKKKDADPT